MQTVYISPLPDREPGRGPRRIAILGSTGSIGTQALDVVEEHPERFEVLALAGGRNAELLARQAVRHRPRLLAVLDEDTAKAVRDLLPAGYAPQILSGPQSYVHVASLPDADMVVSAIVGAAGLPPTFAAVAAGKIVALANKEALVLAGHLIRQACRESGAVILPTASRRPRSCAVSSSPPRAARFGAGTGRSWRASPRPKPWPIPTGAWGPRSPWIPRPS